MTASPVDSVTIGSQDESNIHSASDSDSNLEEDYIHRSAECSEREASADLKDILFKDKHI